MWPLTLLTRSDFGSTMGKPGRPEPDLPGPHVPPPIPTLSGPAQSGTLVLGQREPLRVLIMPPVRSRWLIAE